MDFVDFLGKSIYSSGTFHYVIFLCQRNRRNLFLCSFSGNSAEAEVQLKLAFCGLASFKLLNVDSLLCLAGKTACAVEDNSDPVPIFAFKHILQSLLDFSKLSVSQEGA